MSRAHMIKLEKQQRKNPRAATAAHPFTAEQRDHTRLTADPIEFWRRGELITDEMTLKMAREAVIFGMAYVLSENAIAPIVKGQPAGDAE